MQKNKTKKYNETTKPEKRITNTIDIVNFSKTKIKGFVPGGAGILDVEVQGSRVTRQMTTGAIMCRLQA